VHCKVHTPRTAIKSLFAGRRALTAPRPTQACAAGRACRRSRAARAALPRQRRRAAAQRRQHRVRPGRAAARRGAAGVRRRAALPARHLPCRRGAVCRSLPAPPPTPLTSACPCSGGQTPSACRHPSTHASQLTDPVAWPAPRRARLCQQFLGKGASQLAHQAQHALTGRGVPAPRRRRPPR